jgi:hypothetical protein
MGGSKRIWSQVLSRLCDQEGTGEKVAGLDMARADRLNNRGRRIHQHDDPDGKACLEVLLNFLFFQDRPEVGRCCNSGWCSYCEIRARMYSSSE